MNATQELICTTVQCRVKQGHTQQRNKHYF